MVDLAPSLGCSGWRLAHWRIATCHACPCQMPIGQFGAPNPAYFFMGCMPNCLLFWVKVILIREFCITAKKNHLPTNPSICANFPRAKNLFGFERQEIIWLSRHPCLHAGQLPYYHPATQNPPPTGYGAFSEGFLPLFDPIWHLEP